MSLWNEVLYCAYWRDFSTSIKKIISYLKFRKFHFVSQILQILLVIVLLFSCYKTLSLIFPPDGIKVVFMLQRFVCIHMLYLVLYFTRKLVFSWLFPSLLLVESWLLLLSNLISSCVLIQWTLYILSSLTLKSHLTWNVISTCVHTHTRTSHLPLHSTSF
jgi:hypothetical protein